MRTWVSGLVVVKGSSHRDARLSRDEDMSVCVGSPIPLSESGSRDKRMPQAVVKAVSASASGMHISKPVDTCRSRCPRETSGRRASGLLGQPIRGILFTRTGGQATQNH